MSVFDALFREHLLLTRLVRRLERARRCEPRVGVSEARDVLLVLLPALDRHERLEELVFGAESSEMEAQHRRLDAMRLRLAALAEAADGRREAVLRHDLPLLTALLRRHFDQEERELWPRFRAKGRSIDRALERAARAQVRELERRIAWSWRELADLSHP